MPLDVSSAAPGRRACGSPAIPSNYFRVRMLIFAITQRNGKAGAWRLHLSSPLNGGHTVFFYRASHGGDASRRHGESAHGLRFARLAARPKRGQQVRIQSRNQATAVSRCRCFVASAISMPMSGDVRFEELLRAVRDGSLRLKLDAVSVIARARSPMAVPFRFCVEVLNARFNCRWRLQVGQDLPDDLAPPVASSTRSISPALHQ